MQRIGFISAMMGSALGYPLVMYGWSVDSLVLGVTMAILMFIVGYAIVLAYHGLRRVAPV